MRTERYSVLRASCDGMMALVRDKWLAILSAGVKAEIQWAPQQLVKRVGQLEEICAELTAASEVSLEHLSVKLTEQLKTIGRSE